jgi:malonyl-ACP decarboxylase
MVAMSFSPCDVVVTGIGAVSSAGDDVHALENALRTGRTGIGFASDSAAHAPPYAAELRDFDFRRVLARGSLPERLRERAVKTAGRASSGIRAAAAASLEAWTGAGLEGLADPQRTGVIVCGNNLAGRNSHQVAREYHERPQYVPPRHSLEFQDTDHVGTLSELLEIRGESFTLGGASASGNLGIIQATRLICSGDLDSCLVVGALMDLACLEKQSFLNLGAMAGGSLAGDPSRACRPFDVGCKGFVYGQAAAAIVLEARAHAESRGAPSLAAIAGYAAGLHGSRHAEPSEEGEARVMTEALARARLAPRRISYVNAHGSSSRLGDATEVRALRRAFGADFDAPIINSTKGWIGHCLSAAGVIEAVAVVVQMQVGFLHPNANLDEPIDRDCRFAGSVACAQRVDYALSNAFGFGGFNTSIVFARSGMGGD